MNDPDESVDTTFLETFHGGLSPLMQRDKLPTALQFVSRQIQHAQGRRSSHDMAHLFSIQASIFVAIGNNSEALSSYQRAETLDPSAIHHKLALAHHLIYGEHDPTAALKKIEEAISLAHVDAAAQYALGYARGLRGVALLQAGDNAGATAAWSEIVAVANGTQATVGDLDLLLAEALIDQRFLLPQVARYLQTVAEKANAAPSHDLPQRCARLKKRNWTLSVADSLAANRRMNLSVHASRPLPQRLRLTSPREWRATGRATCPAGYPQRKAACRLQLRLFVLRRTQGTPDGQQHER